MTNEEALEQMKEWYAMMTCDSTNKNPLHLRYVKAVEIAIKALEQQSLEYEPLTIDKLEDEAMQKLLRTFQNQKVLFAERDCLPSVTIIKPQESWIPCSERLPEEYIHVLCQFCIGGMSECYYAHGYFHVVGGLRMTTDEVLAWMPIPPYKAEGSDEE